MICERVSEVFQDVGNKRYLKYNRTFKSDLEDVILPNITDISWKKTTAKN